MNRGSYIKKVLVITSAIVGAHVRRIFSRGRSLPIALPGYRRASSENVKYI